MGALFYTKRSAQSITQNKLNNNSLTENQNAIQKFLENFHYELILMTFSPTLYFQTITSKV
jgi:hypothetical protein